MNFERADLPSDWSWSPLKHVTEVLRRGTAPTYVEDGPIRALSQAANQRAGWDWEKTRFHDYFGNPRLLKGYLEPGDVLINSTGTGTVGRVGFYTAGPDPRPCIADGHLTIARAAEGAIHARFLYYCLKSRLLQDLMMAAFVSGATNQIELNADRLGTAPVPLPPMEEQLRIANFLDVETARLDKMYSMQRRVMDLTDEREAAFMQEMLIDRQDCKFVPLWSLTDAARPVMYGIVLPGPNVDDGVPIVKGGDIGSGRLRVGSLNRTTREIESRYARSRLRGGDLVMAIRGSVGEVGVIPPELSGANLTQDAARIAPSLSVVPRWLQLILATPLVIGEINARVTGATVKGINIWDLKRVSIPAPSVELQQRIVGEVDGELERHARLRVAIKKQLKLLEERRRALITAAVTGQFDVSTAGAGRYG